MVIITNFLIFVKRGALFSAALLFLPEIIFADSASVVFSEIAWMGTKESPNREWIELYNNVDFPVSLKGWRIKADDGTPDILLEKIIPGHSFYLLGRTTDKILPEITADQIYSGALENSGETLRIVDGENNLIDSIETAGAWFAGNNSTKQTMEKKDLAVPGKNRENWQSSRDPGGTPRAANSAGSPVKTASSSAALSRKDDSSSFVAAGLVSPGKIREIRKDDYSSAQTFGLALLAAAIGGTAFFVLKVMVNQDNF